MAAERRQRRRRVGDDDTGTYRHLPLGETRRRACSLGRPGELVAVPPGVQRHEQLPRFEGAAVDRCAVHDGRGVAPKGAAREFRHLVEP